ncbi:MAG: hypothetical protein QOC82_3454 [Frankiaceae bacterium]|nr:hypothetical protein [Frankiaceae bacterium]
MRREHALRRFAALVVLLLGCVGFATTRAATAALPKPTAPDAALAAVPIGHVFLIVLENESYKDTYKHNPNHYLGKKLQRQGTLLTHYYAIGHASLDNYLAMISGQAPNPSTSGDCPAYSKFKPTTHPVTIDQHGQAVGKGCVFPASVPTLADQLSARDISWAGYMEQMGRTPSREQQTCGVPSLNRDGKDATQAATRHDQYAARHNPFVYFHSLLNSGRCASHVVRLGQLHTDLNSVGTTPQFAFITPDLCNDGHDKPCKGTDTAGSRKGGLVSVDHFLRLYVPLIKASPAYQQDGLIIIISDESNRSDTRSCCHEQQGPNQAKPGRIGPGGGKVGSLVIGKCVQRGTKDPARYNHYSLLRSLEDLYGIATGGTDGSGHLGFAAAAGLRPFGTDLFSSC